MNARRRWSEEDDALLRAEAGRRTWGEIGAMIGRSRFAAQRRASELGLTGRLSGSRWSDEEVAILRRDFPHRTSAEVAASLGRGLSAVNIKARGMGLVKEPAHINRMQAQRARVSGGSIGGTAALMGRPWRSSRFGMMGEYTPTMDAVAHLRRLGPIWRCTADGSTDPKGDHWKFSGRVMDAAAVEARAERAGWVRP